jgi:hypothetical protein
MIFTLLARLGRLTRLDPATLRRRALFVVGGIVVGLLAVTMASSSPPIAAVETPTA